MIRKVVLTIAVVLAIVIGAGAFLFLRGAALPGLPLPALPATLAPAIAAADSARIAAIAERRCGRLLTAGRKACYEEFLLGLVQQGKIRLAMGTLDFLGQHDADIRRYGHDYSHVIGISAWEPGKDIGAVYLQCNELFQSGCYHGVIQAFFAYRGTDSASVAALCSQTPGIKDNSWLRFQCVHGIGHGLLQTYTMDLPHALRGCDMLGNRWDSESCYGGAFMEFIVGGRGQSHRVHIRHSGDSAKAGPSMDHDMAGMDSAPAFKARDRSDPLYPCSKLDQKYQRACYEMQAGLIVELTGMDFAKVAQVCETAPDAMRATCFQGIGTYVSGVTARDVSEGIRLCSLGNRHYQPWCFVGLAKNFVDVTANTDDGMALCNRLGPRDIAMKCYEAIGEEAGVLYVQMSRRERVCVAAARGDYQMACRYGARLIAERPEGLPTN